MKHFQAATGYALRILDYIDQENGALVKAVNMSEDMGISYLYLMKILSMLRAKGMIISEQGCRGGYRIKNSTDSVSIYDVIVAIEDDVTLFENSAEVKKDYGEEQVERYFSYIQDWLAAILKQTSVKELFHGDYAGKQYRTVSVRQMESTISVMQK